MIGSKQPFILSSLPSYNVATITHTRFPDSALFLPLAMFSAWSVCLLSLPVKEKSTYVIRCRSKATLEKLLQMSEFSVSLLPNKDKKHVPGIAQNHRMSEL